MRITTATLYVYDPDTMRSKEVDELKAGKRRVESEGRDVTHTIEVRTTFSSLSDMPTHDIRVYADYEAPGCERPMVVDWFEVWAGEISVLGDRLTLRGFGRAPKVRNWTYGDGYSYDGDTGSPFQRVEWIFTEGGRR